MVQEQIDKLSGRLSAAVWSGAGLILSSIGIWTATTLSDLSTSVHGLRTSVSLLEQRMSGLPPPELMLQIQMIMREDEEIKLEQRRLQTLIDRLETLHPGVSKKPLPPYSDNTSEMEDFGYDSACFEGAECRTSDDCGSCECVEGFCSGDYNGDA